MKKEARDRKTVTTYVPDTKKDCIEKTISYFFRNQQLLNSKQNEARSHIRRVHDIKHQETTILTIGPNQRKRPKNIQKQNTAEI